MPEDLYKLIYAEDPPAGLSSDESMEMLQDVPLRKTNKMTRAPSSQLQLAQPQQQANVVQQMASAVVAVMRQMGTIGGGGECDITMLQPKRRKQQKAIEDGQVQETPTPSPPAVTSPAETPTTKGPETADEEPQSKPMPKISPKALFKDEQELDANGQAAIVEGSHRSTANEKACSFQQCHGSQEEQPQGAAEDDEDQKAREGREASSLQLFEEMVQCQTQVRYHELRWAAMPVWPRRLLKGRAVFDC